MQRSNTISSLPRLCLALFAALLVAAPVALAAEAGETETARPEYVAKVDPICNRNARANTRILKGVKRQVQRGGLAPAGRRFIRASLVFGKTTAQIAAIPRPASDSARLTRWIGYLKREKTYLWKIGRLLKARKKNPAYRQAVQLKKNNSRANAAIVGFGFRHCAIDQSKFL